MTPIERTVDAAQDDGVEVWIAGWTECGRYALIVAPDAVSVASYAACNGLGRWEGSRAWYDANRDYLTSRFPQPTR